MGAWGHNAFENDDASDWVWELRDSTDFTVIEAALGAMIDDSAEYLESPQCANALAAAEVVAALNGRPASVLPDDVKSWVKGKPKPNPPLLAKAKKAVARIARSSELRDLWQEGKEFEKWHAAVSDLEARL